MRYWDLAWEKEKLRRYAEKYRGNLRRDGKLTPALRERLYAFKMKRLERNTFARLCQSPEDLYEREIEELTEDFRKERERYVSVDYRKARHENAETEKERE